MSSETSTRALTAYVMAACAVLMLPILVLIILSFSGQDYLKFPPTSFSLRWFTAFFSDPRWLDALRTSVVIAIIACVIATVAGFLAAYAFVRSEMPFKKLLLSLMLLPIIIPNVITAIAMYFLAGRFGLVGNIFWIGVCHSIIALPIVLLILLPSLHGIDVNLERAALSLGSTKLRVFTKIVVPLAFPGILSSILFAFLASFDELLISLFLTGVRHETLPVRIWNSLLLQVEPVIAAVSVFLIGVTGAVLLLDAMMRLRRTRLTGRAQAQ
ncbi:MAG: ABC transporter permease [Candidimonas sp.]|nr:MAG: ABC transporter permease [Candidimonas sp.]TAM25656.1 MAG: ABC transporter permease [Candidimonas sp.]